VEALPTVLRRYPAAKLVVAGRVYYDKFVQRAAELGISDSIICTGAVPKSEIPDLLAAADVESHEQGIGMGTATLEAMAAGTPVVVPGRPDNFPGVELVDGGNVFLCSVDDPVALAEKLITVLGDPAAALAVAAAGQALIHEHFAMTAVVAGHLRVLSELSERGRLPR
jgi:glycosyltransferase involved in cell wall biosynthesis